MGAFVQIFLTDMCTMGIRGVTITGFDFLLMRNH